MLRTARAAQPDRVWVLSDLRDWAPEVAYNLVFSNGALQWIPDHRKVVLRLFETVASGGALAFQVPARPAEGAGWVRALQMLHDRRAWRHLEWSDPVAIHVLRLEDYFDLLAPRARRVDLWDTEYHHILEGPSSVVDWTQATTLRPWLDQLSTEAERVRFLHDYSDAIGRLYAKRPEGHVIFPFLRRFVVAYR
jgi:trans-aconitate 2-methyltransferase